MEGIFQHWKYDTYQMKFKFTLFVILLFVNLLTNCGSNPKMLKPMKYNFNFYTSYHQFYISDYDSAKKTDSKDFWNEQTYKSRLATEKGIVGILTKSYGHIVGELEILEKERVILDTDLYDHIVESGIEVKSGILQILDCPNSNVEGEIKIVPGVYKIRVYSTNLKILEGEDEDEGNDFYKIEIWKEGNPNNKIIKSYESKK